MEANGADLLGEARFVDAMVQRNAPSSTRAAAPAAMPATSPSAVTTSSGWTSTSTLIAIAQAEHPGPTYFAQDLTLLDLAGHGVEAGFDAILCRQCHRSIVEPASHPGQPGSSAGTSTVAPSSASGRDAATSSRTRRCGRQRVGARTGSFRRGTSSPSQTARTSSWPSSTRPEPPQTSGLDRTSSGQASFLRWLHIVEAKTKTTSPIAT